MMRPFLPVLLLCAACGDNLIVDAEEEGPPVNEPDVETVHFAPDICSVRAWPSVPFADRDVDLTVVPTPTGAAIFSVERTGGPLMGFAINNRGELETKELGNIVRDDRTFTGVSAAYIDERLVTAAIADDGTVAVDMIRNDLGARHELGLLRGNLVGDVPIAHAREDRLVSVGASNGIIGMRFDSAWQSQGTQTLNADAPVSMTATSYREDTAIAWSTDTSCSLSRVSAEVTSTRHHACPNARIAIDTAARKGFMVYEEGADKISLAEIRITGEREILDPKLLVEFAWSPKIVFDGSRFWVSYINARNDVVVGYIGEDRTLVSMALEGTQPMADGYELAVLNGMVWVFSVDGSGANAQRLCLKPIY